MRHFRMTPRATAISLALLLLLLVLIVAVSSPIPVISEQYGETSLRFASDRAWALLPGDCVTINWRTEGIESLHVEGHGEIGWGEKPFCPAINAKAAKFAVRTPDGLYREFMLRIEYLPDLLLYLAGFVGVVGSLGLAAFFLITNRLEQALSARWLLVCLSTLMVLGVFLRLNEPQPPRLDVDDGQVKVAMWAEHVDRVFPMECVAVELSAVGTNSLRFNGEEVSLVNSRARSKHCDTDGTAVMLQAIGADDEMRQYTLPIPSLPGGLADLPAFYYASVLALLASALVYLPLALRKGQLVWRRREWTGVLVAGCFAFVMLMLYLPFGFDSAAEWEEWVIQTRIESRARVFNTEMPMRFLLMLPQVLAYQMDSESFASLHLIQFAVLCMQPALLFGILRKLNLRSLHAFLIAGLFLLYPVNDLLLSSPIVVNNTNVMWLLLAVFCALDYLWQPSRLALVGASLALLLNVGMYEAGLALMAALPFLLWIRRGKHSWRRVNLALLFICGSAFKISYMLLLFITDRPFYNERLLASQSDQSVAHLGQNLLDTALAVLPRLAERTFVSGWTEAFSTLFDWQWLVPSCAGVLCIGGMACMLVRGGKRQPRVRITVLILLGSLCAIPFAVGVLMMLPSFSQDEMPRLYFYVPAPAAIAVFCVLLLATTKLKSQRVRDYALIALCLLLMLPALSRLFAQHEMYIRRADNKALIFRQIVELVPRPNPDAYLVVITPMSRDELNDKQVANLSKHRMFASAMLTLYEDHAPIDSFFCRLYDRCSWHGDKSDIFYPHKHTDHWQDTIVLELRRDLVVDLMEDPLTRYGWDIDIDYDPSQLYDADAPIPERAQSMLGGAIRRGDE